MNPAGTHSEGPAGILLKQGWASVSLDEDRELMELRSLYEHFHAGILEMTESLDCG
jgi:hypothetical protein